MSQNYERIITRTRTVLSSEVIEHLGPKGAVALYDAVMIMAFADGEITEDEDRFFDDLAEILGTRGSNQDLTPDSLLGRMAELQTDRSVSEAILKVLLIVSDLDEEVSEDEMKFWYDCGDTLGITRERLTALRRLLAQTHK